MGVRNQADVIPVVVFDSSPGTEIRFISKRDNIIGIIQIVVNGNNILFFQIFGVVNLLIILINNILGGTVLHNRLGGRTDEPIHINADDNGTKCFKLQILHSSGITSEKQAIAIAVIRDPAGISRIFSGM